MRHSLHILICSFFLLFAGGAHTAQVQFMPGVEDLPLMDNLLPVDDVFFSFDTADGRVIEICALGEVERPKVAAYYDQVLPSFGWEKVSALAYQREGEKIKIEVKNAEKEKNMHLVCFLIYPAH
jgi:hypothetical protein